MCRSIKTLREPYTDQVTEDDVRAAAFDTAVDAVTSATRDLLDGLVVRGPR